MASDAEHIFIYLWTLCMSSLEKCLFKSFAHFLIGSFVFLVLSHMNSLYILEIKPLSKVSLANMFSHAVGSLFILPMFSLAMQKLFNLPLFSLPQEIYWGKYCSVRYLKFYSLCFPLGFLWCHDLISLLSILSLFWCMV